MRYGATSSCFPVGYQLMLRTGNPPSASYCHPLYAKSLAEFGEPLELPCSGRWQLERTVTEYPDRDAMGLYPIFAASDSSDLSKDLSEIGPGPVSVGLVADPFGGYLPHLLSARFDRVVGFIEHYVVDVSKPPVVSKHHKYYSRRASADVIVDIANRSYVIHSAVIEYFRSKVQWMDLGVGADALSQRDELSRVKAGGANNSHPAYFCGRSLNPERYDAFTQTLSSVRSSYFPAYRDGELG